jgi:hypothetical protein
MTKTDINLILRMPKCFRLFSGNLAAILAGAGISSVFQATWNPNHPSDEGISLSGALLYSLGQRF